MRVVVAHDQDGIISRLVACPPDAPPVTPEAGLGQYITVLDVPEETLHFLQEGEGTEQQIIEGLKALRVDLKTEARLVPRSGSA